jgi:hypothetical protein
VGPGSEALAFSAPQQSLLIAASSLFLEPLCSLVSFAK